jgi:hypothetical protein
MWTVLFQQFAATTTTTCSGGGFFGVPTWYEYLANSQFMDSSCHFVNASQAQITAWGLTAGQYWSAVVILIALAVLDIVLRIAGLVAFAYVFYGGARYITSHGEPDKTKQAQESIVNALIGLVIALAATTVVSFIGNKLWR